MTSGWADALKVYLTPRILIVTVLGFASGLPLALTASTLTAWLSEAGVDKTSIGLFAAIATPYALKFLWAPLIDGSSFPVLSRLLGRRRGWILATQIALIFSIVMLGFADPAINPWNTAFWAVVVAFCSASQDIVIDAYRVEILKKEEYGAGAAVVQYGYRMGMLASGAGALWLADHNSWQMTYAIMAALMGIGILTVLICPEPETSQAVANQPRRSFRQWATETIIHPFTNFASQPGWWLLLLFIMLYKLGDAFLGTMTNPFLLEIGFTKTEIAAIVKVFGLAATLVGIFIGGLMTYKLGMVRTLWICGIGHALTNLMFVVQARVGSDPALIDMGLFSAPLGSTVLALGITLENLTGGMGAAAFVAFISSLCSVRYTATQYALLSSIAVMGRTWLSTAAGWTAETFGWEPFFVIAVLLAVPGLALLYVVKKRYYDVKSID